MAKPDLSNLDPGTITNAGEEAGVAGDTGAAPLRDSTSSLAAATMSIGSFTGLQTEREQKPRALQYLKGDLAGGITSGVVALPQTITIGALAFAPLGPEYVTFGILAGFYCAIVSGVLWRLSAAPASV